MRPSALHDGQIFEKVVDELALGVPQTLIAKSLGVAENTISGWKKRKEFKKYLALRTIAYVGQPVRAVRHENPLAYLERHPETREAWAPPKIIDQQLTIQTVTVALPQGYQEQIIDVEQPMIAGPDE